ncbi:MAG: 23S rRNA (uracil(1939)-C(5))-methyltransferase RlmD [Oscillospiraceae bacterium]
MNINKNDELEVQISAMTNEGQGVARIDGFTVFVANTAVGDVANIKIIKILPNYAIGKLLDIVSPSSFRQDAQCKDYIRCGGCNLRHIKYENELTIKQGFVKDSFERIAKINAPCREIIPSSIQNGYRNKAQFPVGKDINGNIIFGFFAKRSHVIIPLDSCLLQPDEFTKIAQDILQFIKQNKISVYDPITQKGTLRHIYIRKAQLTNEIMVCLVCAKEKIFNIDKLCTSLTQKYSNIKSIVVNVNLTTGNAILGKKCITVFGNDYITDVLCGITVHISAQSFYQINHDQAENLYNKAIEYACLDDTKTLVDMYCGIGTIGLACANKVKKVIGIEIIPDAIENAKANAKLNNITNATFICDDAKNAANDLVNSGENVNVIIVDPPRKGCDSDVIASIVKLSPERIVMVSCNSATAARDCAILEQNNYKVTEYTPLDMFPRTTHVECVIALQRVE